MGAVIIKGAWLLSESGLKRDSGIRISSGLIEEADLNGKLTVNPGDEVIDAADQIILPGFTNGHNHMYGVLSHGMPSADTVTEFGSFLSDFWWPYMENRLDHKLVEATTRHACVEMIDSGVTSFVDVLEGPNSIPGALDVEASVVEDAGLRAKLSFEACERISRENGELGLKENLDFMKKREGQMVSGLLSIHTLFTCSKEYVQRAKRLTDEIGGMIHMHMCESVFEPNWTMARYGKTPVQIYDELGFLDEHVLISQAVQVTDEDIDILQRSGAHVSSQPLSNCEVGGGFAPISKMLDRGMTVGLGSDGYINNFFEIMRGAFLMHKSNEQTTLTMPADLVYRMGTELGAKACGFEGCGVIRCGAKADVITVDMKRPTSLNEKNVYDQIVLYTNPQNVVNVFCAGKCLKADYKLTTLDKDKVYDEMKEVADRFWK